MVATAIQKYFNENVENNLLFCTHLIRRSYAVHVFSTSGRGNNGVKCSKRISIDSVGRFTDMKIAILAYCMYIRNVRYMTTNVCFFAKATRDNFLRDAFSDAAIIAKNTERFAYKSAILYTPRRTVIRNLSKRDVVRRFSKYRYGANIAIP